MKASELRRIRLRLDLSQEQMAERLGLHKNSLNRYERGHRPISKLLEIAVRCLDRHQGK